MTKIDFIDQTLTELTITTTAAAATTNNNNNNKLKFILPPNSIISHQKKKKKKTFPKFDQKLMLQKPEENTHDTLFDLQKLNC